jgi:hypothetical protein
VTVFRFVAAEKTNHPISLMCRTLGVSRSGFHAWEQRPLSDRAQLDEVLTGRIREMHGRSRDSYGARRIHLDLRDEGVRVGRKRVERLMRTTGISGYVKRRKFRTTFSIRGVRVADDLVERDFQPACPEPPLGLGHQVRLDLGRHPLPGLRDRLLQPQSRRLVDALRHAGRARDRRGRDGDRAPPANRAAHPSFRPRAAKPDQPVVATPVC